MDIENTEERWSKIADWPHYEVSDTGRVRSNRGGRSRVGKFLLVQTPRIAGHLSVNLFNRTERWMAPVHQLVANAFCEPRQVHHVLVRHLDGNPTNNFWKNLKWGTYQENYDDMVRHGRNRFGENAPSSILTNDQVREIFCSSERNKALAAKYNVSEGAVISIRNARSWRSVNGDKPSETGKIYKPGALPTKLNAELAKEIFVSVEPTRNIAKRMGVSESFVSHLRAGNKWSEATAGLVAPETRERATYLKTMTEAQIVEIFMSPLSGKEITDKMGVADGYVSQIRSRLVARHITKDLIPPAREKQNHKLTPEIARQVFLDTRKPKFIAAEFGITRTLVSYIKLRKAWAEATKELTGVVPVAQ